MVLLCHIVGFNNVNKNEFIKDIRNLNTKDNNPMKELIVKDIDELTDEYINNPATKLLNERLKIERDPKKADQYKFQIENSWSEFVTDKINKILKFYGNKLVILIGLSHFIRNHRIKIVIDTKNKIFVDIDLDINSKQIIELNVKKYMKDIINGKYPLKYLDYDFLKKQRLDMGEIYKNEGYIFRPYANIIEIIKKLKLGDNSSNQDNKNITLPKPEKEKMKLNGKNPLKYLDYDFLKKQRLDMGEIYKNEGYIFRPYANIIEIIKKLKLGDNSSNQDNKNITLPKPEKEKMKLNGKNVVINSSLISNKNAPLITIKKNTSQNWAYWASTQKLEKTINPKKNRKEENKSLIYSEQNNNIKLYNTPVEALINMNEIKDDIICIKKNNKYEIKSLPNKLHKYCYLYKVNSSYEILSRSYISDLLDELERMPEIITR